MPLYHCTAKMIGRGSGRSAAAASAYRAGEKLSDKRQGLEWDFTKRGGVSRAEIIAPEGAPAWAHDRQALWNAVEAREDQSKRHATAQTAREFEVSLPHELSREDREAAGLAFARYLVTTYGVAADVSFHDPHPGRNGQGQDERNFHVHILTTTRRVTAEGLGEKVRELDSKATATTHLRAVRAKWAEIANGYLERAGIEARLDHRSFKERGIEQEPTLHLGPAAHAMMKRGEASDRARINHSIEERNAAAARLRVEGQEAGAAIIGF